MMAQERFQEVLDLLVLRTLLEGAGYIDIGSSFHVRQLLMSCSC